MTNNGEQPAHSDEHTTTTDEHRDRAEFRVDEDDVLRWIIHAGFGLIGTVVAGFIGPAAAVYGFFIGIWLSSFIHKTVQVEDGDVVFRPGRGDGPEVVAR